MKMLRLLTFRNETVEKTRKIFDLIIIFFVEFKLPDKQIFTFIENERVHFTLNSNYLAQRITINAFRSFDKSRKRHLSIEHNKKQTPNQRKDYLFLRCHISCQKKKVKFIFCTTRSRLISNCITNVEFPFIS